MKTARIIPTVIAAALFAAALIAPGSAMATKGSCDPSPDPFNEVTLTKGNGTVTIDTRWTWDGVSVYPECDGPIIRIRVTNTGQQTWYAHVQRRRGGTRAVAIEPGADRSYTGAQLAQVGIETIQDLDELTLTLVP